MNDYLITGVLIIAAANYLQIIEEWRDRGLDDTSYKAVLLLIAGPLCTAYGLELQGQRALALVFVGLALCAGVLGALKLRDLIHTRYRTLT